MIKVNSIVEIVAEGCTGSIAVGSIATVKNINEDGMAMVVSGATEEVFAVEDLKETTEGMTKVELLKNIIDLDLRKNNVVKLYLTEAFRGFGKDSYTKESDGTFSIELTLTLVNYYWYYNHSNLDNKMGNHEALPFEGHNGRTTAHISSNKIVKIEVIKQGKARTENPIIKSIIENAPKFKSSESYIEELGLSSK